MQSYQHENLVTIIFSKSRDSANVLLKKKKIFDDFNPINHLYEKQT